MNIQIELGWLFALALVLSGMSLGKAFERARTKGLKPAAKNIRAPGQFPPILVPADAVPLYGVVLCKDELYAATYIAEWTGTFMLKLATGNPNRVDLEITDRAEPLYLVRTPCDLALEFIASSGQ
jgi:hypothetical protein